MSELTLAQRVDAILADPAAAGIVITYDGVLEKKGMELTNCPVVEHVDVEKTMATFGKALIEWALTSSNSATVKDQSIVRDAIFADRKTDRQKLVRRLIEWRLGAKAERHVRTFQGYNGVKYTTLVEAQQASIAYLVDNGVPAQKATEMVMQALK